MNKYQQENEVHESEYFHLGIHFLGHSVLIESAIPCSFLLILDSPWNNRYYRGFFQRPFSYKNTSISC